MVKNNGSWKGDKVGYVAVHEWVYKNLGQSSKCSDCGTTDLNKRYEWANISGKYKRVLSDWKRLCSLCHRKFDGLFGENCYKSKLTEKHVIEIRRLYSTKEYTYERLGKIFNISDGHIWKVANRKVWKHLI